MYFRILNDCSDLRCKPFKVADVAGNRRLYLSTIGYGVLLFAILFGIVPGREVRGQAFLPLTVSDSYTQDFDSYLPVSGSLSWIDGGITMPYWYLQRNPVNPVTILSSDGSSGTGSVYSFGSVGDPDRSLGTVGSASYGNSAWGIQMQNTNPTYVISDFNVSYKGEYWRYGGFCPSPQSTSFYYKKSLGTPIAALTPGVNGTWTSVSALKYTVPANGFSAAAINGNVAPNFNMISSMISGLTLNNNEYVMMKWDDPDYSGANDEGMATDDILISWTLCAPPTTQASDIIATAQNQNDIALQWTNGSGNLRLVKISDVNTFTDPTDGALYPPNTAYAGTGEQVVFNGAGNSVTVTGLVPCKEYFFKVFDYNCSGVNSHYNNTLSGANNPVSISTSSTGFLPALFNITGSGSYCAGGTGVTIGLSGSEIDVSYELYFNGAPIVPPVVTAGTGGAITFVPAQTAAGVYTVVATSTVNIYCHEDMLNPLTVSVVPLPTFTIGTTTGPTTCNGTNGTIQLTGLTPNTIYVVNYILDGTPIGPAPYPSDASGIIILTGPAGSYANITVTLGACVSDPPLSAMLSDPPTPAAPVISASPNPICSGQQTTLTATGCSGSILWSDGGTTSPYIVTLATTTTFTAQCSVNGCLSVNSLPETVNVTVSPVIVSVIPLDPTTCIVPGDGSITLTGLLANTTYDVSYLLGGTLIGPSSLLSDGSGQIIILNLGPGSYTDITVTLNGCSSAPGTSVSLTAPGSPPAPTISAIPDSICAGQSAILTAAGCGGSITWSNAATGSPITVAPTTTTIYTATCEVSGCPSAASNPVTVTVNPAPVISNISHIDPITCGGSEGSITLSGLLANTAYIVNYDTLGTPVAPFTIWSTVLGEIIISGLKAGSYRNITVSLFGCPSAPQAADLIEPNAPATPIISALPSTICVGDQVVLTATGFTGVVKWSDGSIGTPVTVTPIVTTNYTAYCVDNGCQSATSLPQTVTVNPLATQVSLVPTSATNGHANGSLTTLYTGIPPVEYSIDGGATWNSKGLFLGLLPNVPPNTYTLTVRNGNGCIISVPFTIGNNLFSNVILEGDTNMACPGSQVFVNIVATGMADFMSFNMCLTYDASIAVFSGIDQVNGILANVITDSSVPGELQISWSGTALTTIPDGVLIFRLKFTGIASGACLVAWNSSLDPAICGLFNDTGVKLTSKFNPGSATFYLAPTAQIIGSPDVCEGFPVILDASGDTLVHAWTLPNGSSFSGSHYVKDPSTSSDSGPYTLITTNSLGCTDEDVLDVTIRSNPVISLSDRDTLCSGFSITLQPGNGYASYIWQDSTTGPEYTASEEGIYYVTVTDQYGCEGTSETVLLRLCPDEFLIPTAFTPNHDLLNDVFRIIWNADESPSLFRMLIYNQWGRLVYSGTNIYNGWDGEVNGDPCPPGIYTYVISVEKPAGTSPAQQSTVRGLVTLVR